MRYMVWHIAFVIRDHGMHIMTAVLMDNSSKGDRWQTCVSLFPILSAIIELSTIY